MKKKRLITLAIVFLLFSKVTYSQNNNHTNSGRKNIIDLTIGGNGLFGSLNYSRMLVVKSSFFINTSVGVGIDPFSNGYTIPHQLTLNFGKNKSFLEIGVGGTYWTGKSNASAYTETLRSYQVSPIVGWRKHYDNNLVFRLYANPLFHISGEYFIDEYSIIPYLGISLGYSF